MAKMLPHFSSFRSSLAIGLFAGLYASAAMAQVSPPAAVDPGQIERRFDEPVQPLPAAPTPTEAPKLPMQKLSASASRSFVLNDVNIEGNTVYTDAELAPFYDEMLDQKITLAEAQGIAERITAKYRADGYVLSQAILPSQNIKDGMLTVRVYEGFIANVIIEGDVRENSYRKLIESYGENLKAQRPMNLATMERYLLLMDDLPGATARGTVRPSATTEGAADLIVNISHKTWDFSLSTDNRGSKYIGPWQHTATAAANSVLGLYERTLVRAITTSPVSELQFGDIQHEQQIGTEGTRLIFTGAYSRTEPRHTLASLDIEGRSLFLQVKATHPFLRSRTENFVGRASFDYRNTDTDILGLEFSDDRLRVARLGAEYDFADGLRGVNLIDIEMSQGLDIFNGSEAGIERSRADGESDFTKFTVDISRTQPLPMGFSILTAASTQYALDRLLASEQFSIGGPSFGQAYDPSELSGDHGMAAKVELRYGEALGHQYLNSYQLFTYYDIGGVWTKGIDNRKNTLASTGFGARANFTPWLSGSAEIGFPLTADVAAEGDDDPRLFIGATARF